MEVCHPMDESLEQLTTAHHTMKMCTRRQLMESHGEVACISGGRIASRDPRKGRR